ncbi:MAG: YggT family protein [Thermoleophilaceae bacterium]
MTLYALAITRGDVADYVSTFIAVYIVMIFIRILMTWIRNIPYYRWLDAFLEFVTNVTDPYLRLFRRVLPLVRIGPGAMDISPVIATFVLIIGGRIVTNLIRG